MLSGMAWLFVGPCSAVAALVALALAPFSRTAGAARALRRVALWGGLLAVALAVIATAFIAVDRDVEFGSAAYRHRVGESLLMALVTVIVTITAAAAGYWSLRTVKHRDVTRVA